MKKRLSFLLACLLSVALVLSVSADKDAASLADAVSLPAALVKGHSYSLPTQLGGETVTFSVNGQACQGSFTAEGEQAVIAYATAEGETIGSYTLPVIDTNASNDHCAYFYAPDGAVTVQENENDISLSCTQDAQAAFVSKLNGENFALNVSFPQDGCNYKTLNLTLTDAADGSNAVTFRIDPNALSVKANESSVKLEQLGNPMQLMYKNLNRSLYDGETLLLSCEKNDKGDAFAGFAGGVYLTIGFEGVTGNAQVQLRRIGNQPLGHKNSHDADLTEPAIVLTSSLNSTQYMGDTFNIPAFEAYDVFSSITESAVSVEKPDGSTASEAFAIDQYGRYKIVFSAKDACGNSVKTNKLVFVNDDIAPQLSVNALEKTEYKLGDAVTFPGYSASDNLEVCNVDVILILPNSEVRLLTHDANGEVSYAVADSALYNASFRNDNSSFKTEQTGTYTLRYVAYDDQFNKAVQELTFTVK